MTRKSASMLDYATPNRRRRPWGRVVEIVVVVGIILLLIALLQPFLPNHNGRKPRSWFQMRQIENLITLFRNDHQGVYPASLDELLHSRYATPSDLTFLNALQQPPFTYLGNGLDTTSATSDTIVIYELLKYPPGGSLSVLFADGHIANLQPVVGAKIIAAATTEHFPIRLNEKTGVVSSVPR